MANWSEIAAENYRIAVTLDRASSYRAACNRYYYAAFHYLTGELISRGATPPFTGGVQTPGHRQLPALIDAYFQHMSIRKRASISQAIQNLRRRREAADYTLQTIDDVFARESHRYVNQIVRHLGVEL